MAIINNIYSGRYIFSEKAFDIIKTILLKIAPFVFREITEDETKRMAELSGIPEGLQNSEIVEAILQRNIEGKIEQQYYWSYLKTFNDFGAKALNNFEHSHVVRVGHLIESSTVISFIRSIQAPAWYVCFCRMG